MSEAAATTRDNMPHTGMGHALIRRKAFTFDQGIKYFFRINASVAILVILAIVFFLMQQGVPFFFKEPAGKLLGGTWAPYVETNPEFGIWPLFAASLWVVGLSMIISLPLGVCAAMYISEVASDREKSFLKNFIEILASFPSVVLGFFALAVLAPIVKTVFHHRDGMTLLTASIVLAVMALPTITSISEDAIRNVPLSYRRASLALGAGRLATLLRVTLPAAKNGVIAAFMLGIGRVIGETMAVLMVAGGSPVVPTSPLSPGRVMTATIASETGEVSHFSAQYNALFLIGALLFFITLAINLVILRMTSAKEYKE
jgi:phosphate transport system permease protein